MTQERYSNGKPKGKVRYYLPTFETEVDGRCFPLSYNLDKVQCGLEPNTTCFCDSPECHNKLVLLSENFNRGLMNESEEETEEVTSSNDDNSRDLELSSAEEAEKYYN